MLKKRLLSVLLCLCMVVGMLPIMTPIAQAAGTGVIDRLNQLRNDYPDYQYWYRVNGINQVTTTPCPHRYINNSLIDCGWYNSGWQCWAFASKIFCEVFGQNPNVYGDQRKDKENIRVGDYVRYSWPNNKTYGHSFVVLSVSGSTVTAVECNTEEGSCRIRWDRGVYNLNSGMKAYDPWGNLTNYYFDYYCRATNYDEINSTSSQPTAPAQYIGEDFYAYIYNAHSNCNLEARNSNVQTSSISQFDPRQIWHFIYDSSSGSYKIVNAYDGLCLEAVNWGTSLGTNIQTYINNNTTAQRWWVCGSREQCYLTPIYMSNHDLVMEVTDGNNVKPAGTNIQLYTNWYREEGYGFHRAQTFQIKKADSYVRPAKPSTPTFRSITANPEWTNISWNAVSPVNSYDSREYILEIYDVTNSRYVLRNQHVTGTSYTTTLPVGSYRAEIQAVNTKYVNYKSDWNMSGHFTVYPFRNITLTANPAEGGTVNGGGSYCQGDYTTLQAKPNEGWRFVGWTRNGQAVTDWVDEGTSVANYGLTVTGDESFEALFEKETLPTPIYTISVSCDLADGGTVAGGGTYDEGASVTVTAEAREGYDFKGWRENGSIVSTVASYTFTAGADRTLTAVFEAKPVPKYTVSVSASPAEGGSVTGGGTSIEQGTPVTVTAAANEGYTLKHWAEAGSAVSSDSSYAFTANGDRALTAVFEKIPDVTPPEPTKYTITVNAEPGGAVSGGGTYEENQQVTLTATPASGYRFVEWRKGGTKVSESASYGITVSSNETYTAIFERLPVNYTVNVTSSGGGTVTGGGSYREGTSVTVTAVPASGYRFTEWRENGTKVSDNASYTFIIDKNRTLTAIFEKAETPAVSYIVFLSATPGGTVTGSGSYAENAAVTVTATPADGYHFVEWQENDEKVSDGTLYQFNITGNRTLRAIFALDAPAQTLRYSVEVDAVPAEGGTVTGNGSYDRGTPVTIAATPASGYRFVEWRANGAQVSATASYTFTANANQTFTAVFEVQNGTSTPPTPSIYTISVTADPAAGGIVSGGGSYQDGASVTTIAAANSGYRFTGWMEDGVQVSTSASYTFIANADRTLVARFTYVGGSPIISPGDSTTPSGNNHSNADNSTGTTSSLPVTTTATSSGTVTTASPEAAANSGIATSAITSEIVREIIKQAVANNSGEVVIAPVVKTDVTKAEITIPAAVLTELEQKTNAGLVISTPHADVSFQNSGLSELSDRQDIVVSTERTGTALELSITVDGQIVESVPGGMVLIAPVDRSTPSTVAVLVHKDGSRQVIRRSMADENTITIPLDGSAKLEIIDNAKSFADVSTDSWVANAVAFASGHELFSGTGSDMFSPDLPMTRGMLAMVLHNLENNPAQPGARMFSDVASDAWYSDAVAWAAARGVVSGYGNGLFGPGDNITREQLAVMLWRYAGEPAATNKELHFSDANEISGYALDALKWTVENGVVNGKGDIILDPKGFATRAQVAQVFMNYLKQ